MICQFCFSAFAGTTPASGVASGALAGGIVVRSLIYVPREGARHDTRGGCSTLFTLFGNETIEIFPTTPYLRALLPDLCLLIFSFIYAATNDFLVFAWLLAE